MTTQMKATEQYFSVVLFIMLYKVVLALQSKETIPRGGGGTLGISGWGCAAGTLEPFTYTTASSTEFCYPILE